MAQPLPVMKMFTGINTQGWTVGNHCMLAQANSGQSAVLTGRKAYL